MGLLGRSLRGRGPPSDSSVGSTTSQDRPPRRSGPTEKRRRLETEESDADSARGRPPAARLTRRRSPLGPPPGPPPWRLPARRLEPAVGGNNSRHSYRLNLEGPGVAGRPIDAMAPPPVPRGVWFGHNHRLNIEGRGVAGRWIDAWHELWVCSRHSPLPKVFQKGGDERRVAHRDGDPRVNAVMELVARYHMEFREWSVEHWGPTPPRLRPAFGDTGGPQWQGWHAYDGRPWPTDPWFSHPQLQTRIGPGASAAPGNSSTLLRACSGLREGYESRDVFIVSLPELLIHFLHTRSAAQILDEWLDQEVIIGRKSWTAMLHR